MKWVLWMILPAVSMAQPVSLKEVLDKIHESDIALKQIIHQKKQTGYLRDLSMPSEQILLQFRNEYGLVTRGTGNTSILSASATKDITQTGTSVSVGYTNNNQIGRSEKTVNLRVEQSLLENFFGARTRKLGRALDLESKVVLLEVAEAYEDYLADIIGQYLDWQLAYLNREAAQSLYNEAVRLTKNLKRRKAKSIASAIDVDKAILQELTRQEALLREEADFLALKDTIVAVSGLSEALQPGKETPFEKDLPNFTDDKKKFEASGRSLKLARLTEEAQVERLEYTKADTLPDLRLVAGYNIDNSVRFSATADRGEAVIGVNLVYPLGDSQTEAAVRQAAYQRDQAVFTRKTSERTVRASLASLEQRLLKKQNEAEVGKQKFALAKNVARRELERYRQGRVNFETMLTAQNELATHQFAHLRQRVELAKLVVDWHRSTDQLLESRVIQGANLQESTLLK